MKMIHCADIHLDAAMKKNLNKEQSKQRKNELLLTFEEMVKYAKENEVQVILIAGDLFDTTNVTKKTGNIVRNCIKQAEEIDFFYLKGNHDGFGFFENQEEEPLHNLKLFNDAWTSYEYPEVTITGAELTKENHATIFKELMLEYDKTNIVMLHGQESNYTGKDTAELVELSELKNKYIDYLALGHLHTYKSAALDERGVYCYSGCLEGRGFDECGEKGFVLLEIENGNISHEFIPFAKRQLHEVNVDISGCNATTEIAERIKDALEDVLQQDMVRVILTGEIAMGSERNLSYLQEKFSNDYYAFSVKDKSVLKIEPSDFKNDVSLKGEFIRLCMEQPLEEEQKRKVIELGIHALLGEEL